MQLFGKAAIKRYVFAENSDHDLYRGIEVELKDVKLVLRRPKFLKPADKEFGIIFDLTDSGTFVVRCVPMNMLEVKESKRASAEVSLKAQGKEITEEALDAEEEKLESVEPLKGEETFSPIKAEDSKSGDSESTENPEVAKPPARKTSVRKSKDSIRRLLRKGK